jgi:hypothetical protein
MPKVKFKLPRRKKKLLKKGFWLYLPDENGDSLSAKPSKYEEDYIALKEGRLRNLFDINKKRQKEFIHKLDRQISVSDVTLLSYVYEIFAEEFRSSSYEILIRAKNNERLVKAYYNFINAFEEYKKGNDSYGNICGMSVDLAKDLLKPKKN